jgi:YVTN family beta-propeller protein
MKMHQDLDLRVTAEGRILPLSLYAVIFVSLVTFPLLARPQKVPDQAGGSGPRTIVHQGIATEFSMEPVPAEERSSGAFREGDDVVFRFTMKDTATGTPLAKANPAAWMSLRPEGQARAPTCTEKVKEFLSGSLFAQAELDLNVYYVLALNHDATITVVDPLFGFGGTKLLALVALKSPGEDWVLTSDEGRLFVSMPEANQVAVVDTISWKVIRNLDVGPHPTRLALQPDQQYLWVAHGAAGSQGEDPGITVVTAARLQAAARIPTGMGPHQMAFSDDNRLAFVTNRDDGTVSLIDVRELKKIKDLKTGRLPTFIAFSTLSRMAYVVNEGDGTIVVVDGTRQEIVARMQAEPGLGQIKFTPGGRLGFVVNPEKDVVHILDAATNRIVQTADVEDGPDQLAFSTELAYVRHRDSETVLMIPLKEVGVQGRPVSVVDFPGGQNPFGKISRPSPADAIVEAPGENAVLVANPADKAIYFYKEGMAAPMGNFSNYSREPRAVLVVDRSLRERSPGVYETTAKLRRPGFYDLAFFLDTPRIVHCFEVSVDPNPELAAQRKGRPVDIEPLINSRLVPVGEPVRLRFRLTDPATKQPKADLKDVRVLTFLAPGIWHQREWAQPAGAGTYEMDFVPPQPGIYYVYVECPSLGLTLNNPQYVVLEARRVKGGSEP